MLTGDLKFQKASIYMAKGQTQPVTQCLHYLKDGATLAPPRYCVRQDWGSGAA